MAAVYYKDWLVALTLTRENRVLCGKAKGLRKVYEQEKLCKT